MLLARGGVIDALSGLGRTHHALVRLLNDDAVTGFELAQVVEHEPGGSGLKRLWRRWNRHPHHVSDMAEAGATGAAHLLHITDQEQAGLVPKRRSLPVSVTVHDLFHVEAIQPDADPLITAGDPRPGLIRRMDLNRILAGLARADLLICDSDASQATVQRFLPGARTTVARLGIDPEASHPASNDHPHPAFLPADALCVLLVGSEAPRKRIGFLIEALASLDDEVKTELRLVKIGAESDPAKRAEFGHAATTTGLKLDWVGRVSDDDLLAAYQHADALAFPSALEGFGFPPLEALAAGCPVLAADRPAHNEVLQGLPAPSALLPHDDPAAWVAAITDLHAHWATEGTRPRPSPGTTEHASQYDLAAHADSMARAWTALLDG